MRPDFLFNYICLAPTYDETNRAFDVMFPSLLGVTVSHHISPDITTSIHEAIRDHASRDPARVRAILSTMTEKLTSEGVPGAPGIRHYLDEQMERLRREARQAAKKLENQKPRRTISTANTPR
jgi:hypothetical protein